MILDHNLIFSEAQAVTDDAYSTNYWDKGAAGNLGKDPWLVVRVTEAFVSAGGATLQIELRTSAGLTGSDLNSSYVKLLISKAFTVAQLAVDTVIWKVRIPKGLLRYTQLYYEAATSTFSAGKVTAAIVPDVEDRP